MTGYYLLCLLSKNEIKFDDYILNKKEIIKELIEYNQLDIDSTILDKDFICSHVAFYNSDNRTVKIAIMYKLNGNISDSEEYADMYIPCKNTILENNLECTISKISSVAEVKISKLKHKDGINDIYFVSVFINNTRVWFYETGDKLLNTLERCQVKLSNMGIL